ncbi:MAG: DEAD/DEAH box helicase [Deltaproteobacteria bacterium]|nr:DEAD/DEAH box helicase [Deltaproteobacteria bacterium]
MRAVTGERDERGTALRRVIDGWTQGRDGARFAVDVTSLPRAASHARIPDFVPEAVAGALAALGAGKPYAHQVEAWELIERGRSVVVATPTASGKTLCYNVPVLCALARDPEARALYLFPTKALARDQEQAVRALMEASGLAPAVAVYDGDTPADHRRAIRGSARVVITNPDMLHTGILPHHTRWAPFFARLGLVVVDELHQYRGVFGSHVANVMRRLGRVAAFHGSKPVFAASSATIRNPDDLAATLFGREVTLVSRSGAPSGPRTFMVYNPGFANEALGIRRSAIKAAARLSADLVAAGVKTLVFCQTRQSVEICLRYLRDRLASEGRDPSRVRGYRGGYLPSLRREIETSLRDGVLDAVVATNALELGIDVGALDAVVMAGYPGTIAALHQRGGRAGRRFGPSLSLLVAGPGPLDQFLAREPAYLTGSSPEAALVAPDNVEVLLAHLTCAAFELPFPKGERFGSLEASDTEAALECLADEGRLSLSGDRYYDIGSAFAAAQVSLRSAGESRVTVVGEESGEPLADVDGRRARLELHEQAVYQHEGETFEVTRLDLEARRAHVRPVDPVYYTAPVCHADVSVLEERERRAVPAGAVATGDVRVTEEVVAFKKIRFHTHENLGMGPVSLPPLSMDTEAVWLAPDAAAVPGLKHGPEGDLAAGLEGLGHALHQIASLRLMCDARDLSFVVRGAPGPTLFLYDAAAGGVGLAARLYDELPAALADTLRLVRGCGCARGCPSCVGPGEEGRPPVKLLAVAVASALAPDGEVR